MKGIQDKSMEESKLMLIEDMIYEIREQKVMFDSDLAQLYGVEIKRLNEAVKRNIRRFPLEFMFKLTDEEWKNQRSQFATFNSSIRKYRPHVFTEHGILMLSSVLNSEKAIDINIQIMQIFVKMRKYVVSQNKTNEQITELHKLLMIHIENNDIKFSEHEKLISQVFSVLNRLLEKPKETKTIGFYTGKDTD